MRIRPRRALVCSVILLGATGLARMASAQGAPPAKPATSAAPAAPPAAPPASAPAPVEAAPPPTPDQIAKAKTLFDLGAKAYDAEQFPAAIQAFQEAYRLSQRPGPIFSVAQAYRRQYNVDHNPDTLRQAVAYYKQYVDKQKTGGRVGEAQQALRDLEPILAQLATSGPAAPVAVVPVDTKPHTRLMVSSPTRGALASLDGGEPSEMPLIQELTIGNHTLKIAADGYVDDERVIAAAEGQVYGLDIPLRERPAVLTVKTDAGAEVSIDGRAEGVAPLPRPLELPSGSHLVTITKTGYRAYSAETELHRDEKRALDVTLERTTQRYAALGVLGVAAAGAVAGGVITGLAFYEQGVAKRIEGTVATQNISEQQRADHESAIANRDAYRNVAFGVFGGVGLAALVGAGLYFFDRPSSALTTKLRDDAPKKPATALSPRKVTVSALPLISPTGGGGVLQFRF